jgi:hypothetical protein
MRQQAVTFRQRGRVVADGPLTWSPALATAAQSQRSSMPAELSFGLMARVHQLLGSGPRVGGDPGRQGLLWWKRAIAIHSAPLLPGPAA